MIHFSTFAQVLKVVPQITSEGDNRSRMKKSTFCWYTKSAINTLYRHDTFFQHLHRESDTNSVSSKEGCLKATFPYYEWGCQSLKSRKIIFLLIYKKLLLTLSTVMTYIHSHWKIALALKVISQTRVSLV